MRFLFGDDAPSFDTVWTAFQQEQKRDDGSTWLHLSNTWDGMKSALHRLSHDGDWPLEVAFAMVAPSAEYREMFSYSWGPRVSGYDYARQLDAWLRAGNLALGEVMLHACETGEWKIDGNGKAVRNHIDHFWLYDGVRCGWRKHPSVDGARSLVYQIHVVDSSAGGRAFWIDVDDLLHRHGAGAWWLVRRKDYGDLVESA